MSSSSQFSKGAQPPIALHRGGSSPQAPTQSAPMQVTNRIVKVTDSQADCNFGKGVIIEQHSQDFYGFLHFKIHLHCFPRGQ